MGEREVAPSGGGRLLLAQGSLSVFWANPLVTAIMALALTLLFQPLYAFVRDRAAAAPAR